MFKVGEPRIKTFCQECGNIAKVEIIRSNKPSANPSIIFLLLSIFVITLMGLAKLLI